MSAFATSDDFDEAPWPDVDDLALESVDHPAALIVGADEYRLSVPAIVPWVCKPIAYLGGVAMIAGGPKAGKSTLMAQLQRCRETGEPFLGSWDVTTGPTLLVTEEGGVAVVHKINGIHALDILDRRTAVAAGLTFAQVLEAIATWGETHRGGLVFIDTLAIWAGIENENDASEATRAVDAVTALAQSTNLAIVLVHHTRKSGGENGEAIRGSGAILAVVDIAAELTRVSDGADDRYLDVRGRVILPERFTLSFDRDTLSYRLISRSDARLAEIEGYLEGVPADGPGLSSTDLANLWQVNPRRRCEHLLDVGRMRREWVVNGRIHGWRYWAIPGVEA